MIIGDVSGSEVDVDMNVVVEAVDDFVFKCV